MSDELLKKVEDAIRAGAADVDTICAKVGLPRLDVQVLILRLRNEGRLPKAAAPR